MRQSVAACLPNVGLAVVIHARSGVNDGSTVAHDVQEWRLIGQECCWIQSIHAVLVHHYTCLARPAYEGCKGMYRFIDGQQTLGHVLAQVLYLRMLLQVSPARKSERC